MYESQKINIIPWHKLNNSSKCEILLFYRLVKPNNVPVRSAIPTNNIFRLKITIF